MKKKMKRHPPAMTPPPCTAAGAVISLSQANRRLMRELELLRERYNGALDAVRALTTPLTD